MSFENAATQAGVEHAWPLLNNVGSVDTPGTNLVPILEQNVAVIPTQQDALRPQYIPLKGSKWQIKDGIAYGQISESYPTIVSTDPTITRIIPKLQKVEDWIGTTWFPGTGTALMGALVAQPNYSAWMIGGGIAGVVVPEAILIKRAKHLRQKLGTAVAASSVTYEIPNDGERTKNLGNLAKKIIKTDKDPRARLKGILPVLRTIMESEVALAKVEPQIEVISERQSHGASTETDDRNLGELQLTQNELIATSYKARTQLGIIDSEQRYFVSVKEHFKAGDETAAVKSDLHEFCEATGQEIARACLTRLLDSKEGDLMVMATVLDGWSTVIKNIGTMDTMRGVYEAFRSTCKQRGIIIADFDSVWESIVAKRELR